MKIIKLYLEGCSPCMSVTQTLKDLKLEATPIEVSSDQDKWIKKYNLENIPTLIFETEGEKEVGRLEGWIEKEDILAIINK